MNQALRSSQSSQAHKDTKGHLFCCRDVLFSRYGDMSVGITNRSSVVVILHYMLQYVGNVESIYSKALNIESAVCLRPPSVYPAM